MAADALFDTAEMYAGAASAGGHGQPVSARPARGSNVPEGRDIGTASLQEGQLAALREAAPEAVFQQADEMMAASRARWNNAEGAVMMADFPGGGASKGADSGRRTLYHYTSEKGLAGILDSGNLRPSVRAVNPKDARYGDGQYLSDIAPGTRTPAELSYDFLRLPYQGRRFTHYVEVDVTDLPVVEGRPGVFVVPNDAPLDISNRLISSGWWKQ